MAARALLASCAVLALAYAAYARRDIEVRVYPPTTRSQQSLLNEYIDIVTQLTSVRSHAEHLYTDFSSRLTNNMNAVVENITNCVESTRRNCNQHNNSSEHNQCWVRFEYRLQKIAHDARKKAEDSTEIHTKYLKGYMLVARMNLDKSGNFLRRYHRFIRGCRLTCTATARISRCHRLAMEKIRRIRNDLPFMRRSYHDLLCHSRQELRQFERLASIQAKQAVDDLKICILRR